MSYFGYRTKLARILASVLCFSLFLGLLGLGFWQLDRAQQKKDRIRFLQTRAQEDPIKLSQEVTDPQTLLYRSVVLEGEYDSDHQLLLDNRVVDGRVGVFVLTPLKIKDSKRAVLINRGWAPMTSSRKITTDLEVPSGAVEIQGVVKHFPGLGFEFSGSELPAGGWPGLIQRVDVDYLSRLLGYPLLPFQILLDLDSGPGFLREWHEEDPIRPEKHLGYAFQWFALAALLVVMCLWAKLKKYE